MEAQLGLIGGTMGLLTGFSILSAVEIIYYLLRFFKSDFKDHSLNPQVLHVSQGPQSCGGVCCQQKIWKPSDKEGLKMRKCSIFSIDVHIALLTGFSILSGVEIIYYLLGFLWFALRDHSLNPQVLYVSQGPQSCTSVCCQ